MARSRLLKPEFFENETLAELPFQTRLCFAGLWTLADREGRLKDRPKRIGAKLFPYDEVDIEAMLDALAAKGFIDRYQANGTDVIAIPTFLEHQSPHVRENPSVLPARDEHQTSLVLAPDKASPRSPVSVSVSVSDPVVVPTAARGQVRAFQKENVSDELAQRAGDLVNRYAELFIQHRRGARCKRSPALDFQKALDLVTTWPDNARLEKLAEIILTTDDDWISRTDRGFAIFALKATWADDRLAAWEAQHARTA